MANSMESPGKANSPLTAWIARWDCKTFYLLDIDAMVMKRSEKVVRFIEYKHPNERLRPSQRAAFGILSEWIASDIDGGKIHSSSGCYVVRAPESCFERNPNNLPRPTGNDQITALRWRDRKRVSLTPAQLLSLMGGNT